MVTKVKNERLFCTVFLRPSRRKNDQQFIVFVGIYLNGERFSFSLGYYIDKDDWDETAKRPIVKDKRPDLQQLNSIITVTLSKLQQSYEYLKGLKNDVTALDVISCYRGEDTKPMVKKDHGVIYIFNKETERLTKNNYIVASTIERREVVRRTFSEFIEKTYKMHDYPVEKVNSEYIRQYETFLLHDRGQSKNTLYRSMKFLKSVILYAMANGYISINPFYGIVFHTEPVDHPFLTVNELQTILSKKIEILRIAAVRDIFCFCCLTGLAYADVAALKRDDVFENLGDYWIRKQRQKSSQFFEVPLCDVAYAIVKKYVDNPLPTSSAGQIFPVSSNQKMNAYLKELADICGIHKNLTTHCARRTFATLSQAFGSKLQNIARMMGHANVTMTQKYAQILDTSILEDSNRMNGQFTYEQ